MLEVAFKEERRNAFHIMTAYRITAVGFENREAIFFRTTVEMASNHDLAEWCWVDDLNADVVVVNADRKQFTSEFTSEKFAQANVKTILIACSSRGERSDSFSHTLQKPITYSMIISLLLELEHALAPVASTTSSLSQPTDTVIKKQMISEAGLQPETHTSSASHDLDQIDQHNNVDYDNDFYLNDLIIDSELDSRESEVVITENSNVQQVDKEQGKAKKRSNWTKILKKINFPTRRFNEEKRFLGLVRNLVSLGRSTEIKHYIYPPVRIYPEQQVFAQKSCHGLSPELFSAQVSGFSSHELKTDEQEPPDGWDTCPLWLIFYLAALYGSRGRLKKNHNLQDRLSLTSIPDFDLVPHDFGYKAIADFMMVNESQEITAIADGSGVNIETVIDFCSACEEIDVIDRTTSN
ncbi:MAG: hypothetical protein ABW139_13045 [Candidatus Thiodiazotropha sp. DIVDIV]